MSKSPAAILFDQNGNPVGVVLDGATYKLQVDASLEAGHGLATDATASSIDATASGIDSTLTSIDGKDFATETTQATLGTEVTLAAIESKVSTESTLSAIDATSSGIDSKLNSIDGKDFATETTLSSLDSTAATLATEATLSSLAAKDFATETTLSAVDATASGIQSTLTSIDGKDFATETTISLLRTDFNNEDFATETTQATLSTENTLQNVLATGQNIATTNSGIRNEVAQETTLQSLDGKDFSTETTLSGVDTKLATIDGVLDSIKDTDGIKKITDALPVGDNIIGRVKITDGTEVADVTTTSGINRLEVRSLISSADGSTHVGIDGTHLEVVDESYSVARDEIVGTDNHREGLIGAPDYALMIDLDNEGGFYKHSPSSIGLELYSVNATLVKSSTGADWRVNGGVILEIDGTSAEVAWLEFLTLHAEDTSTTLATKQREAFPIPIDITVSAGVLAKIATGYVETITAINTGITLDDIDGQARTPAIGDIVARVVKNSGAGTARIHASLWYRGIV